MNTEMKNTNRKAHILRAIFRPLLHVSVEILGFLAIVFFVTIGASVAVLLATAMTSYVTKNSGISGTQEAVVVITVAGAMIYTLFAEAKKARRLLKMWTDHMHKQINSISTIKEGRCDMKIKKNIIIISGVALALVIAIGIAVMPSKEERREAAQRKALEQYTEQAIKQELERQQKPQVPPINMGGEQLGSKSRNR